MSGDASLTVVVARRDPWISPEAALASVAPLGEALVLDAPPGVDPCGGYSPPGAWTEPRADASGWAAAAALEHGSASWVLLLDVDERLGVGLAEEIGARIAAGGPEVGFELELERRFLGRRLRSARAPRAAGLRLVRRDAVRADVLGAGFVPESAEARVGRLERALVHDPFASLDACMRRLDREASLQGRMLAGLGDAPRLARVILGPARAFAHRWLLRGSIVDGTPGLIQAAFEAAFEAVRTAKLWELGMPARLRRVPSLPEPPP